MGDYADDFGEGPAERAATPGKKKKGSALRTCCACGCLAILVFALLSALLIKKAADGTTDDPVLAAQRLQSIVSSTVPQGYAAKGAVELPFLFSAASIMPSGGGDATIILVYASSFTLDPHQIVDIMRAQLQQQGANEKTKIEPVSTVKLDLPVRGASVSFDDDRLDVTDDKQNKTRVRMVSGVVPPAAGSSASAVTIIVIGPEALFDEAAMKAYLESIR